MQRSKAQSAADVIARECFGVRVRLLNRLVTNIYDETLRPLGITVGQMNILVAVAKGQPVRPGEIGRRLHMEKSTLSRNLERMERRGWVRMQPGTDARSQDLTLTTGGGKMLEQAFPLWKRAQGRVRSILGQGGAEAVSRTANKIWREQG